MPDPVSNSNALWTKLALLLLGSIAACGFALLGCVLCLIPLAERKEPVPEVAADLAARSKDVEPVEPLPAQDKDEKVRSKTPGVMLPLDQAIFLGTPAQGRRFCIIADASNSMKGAPLNHVKKEIFQTLGGLKSTSQFYVIFFNATDVPMPYPSWLDANAENINKVRPWIQNMKTVLKTWPTSSFDRAFKLQPKPDVIFFMTDGFIPAKENAASHIAGLNAEEPRVAIHTILFSKAKSGEAKIAPAAAQLRGIAEKNGGSFRRVNQK